MEALSVALSLCTIFPSIFHFSSGFSQKSAHTFIIFYEIYPKTHIPLTLIHLRRRNSELKRFGSRSPWAVYTRWPYSRRPLI